MNKHHVNYIVQILLDVDWPHGVALKADWVKWRFNFLKQFTLKSLFNQTFQDFKIYVICGRRHQDITKPLWAKYNFPNVVPIYPVGDASLEATFMWIYKLPDRVPTLEIKEWAELNDSDWICIARIDSDDLMHKGAMALIKDHTERILMNGYDGNRADMVFRDYLFWDTFNWYIRPHKTKSSPPFHVHIMPKRIYKHWPIFRDIHHLHHRRAVKNPVVLPPDYICVTDHRYKIFRIEKEKGHREKIERKINDGKKLIKEKKRVGPKIGKGGRYIFQKEMNLLTKRLSNQEAKLEQFMVIPSHPRKDLIRKTPGATGNREKMVQVLQNFGVDPNYIVGDLSE